VAPLGSYEVVFVDDGSADAILIALRSAAAQDLGLKTAKRHEMEFLSEVLAVSTDTKKNCTCFPWSLQWIFCTKGTVVVPFI
jgi:glycosyltransferase involved in cell wall biosynthesis